MTYFEQVFHRFDGNSEIKKDISYCQNEISPTSAEILQLPIYQKFQKHFNGKETNCFR